MGRAFIRCDPTGFPNARVAASGLFGPVRSTVRVSPRSEGNDTSDKGADTDSVTGSPAQKGSLSNSADESVKQISDQQ